MQSRRQFCAGACHAALVTGGLGTLAGCGGGGGGGGSASPSGTVTGQNLPRLSASLSGNTASLTIDATSPLASPDGAAFVQAGPSQFLVARTGAATFTVLTATCTHEMCAITGFADTRYVCPCHGSTFDRNGRVLIGPATTALRSFPSTFSGNVLVIQL